MNRTCRSSSDAEGGCELDSEDPHTVGPGAKVEDIELRKAMSDKWGGVTSIRRTATPRPQRGVDEAEVEETDPSKLNAPRWFIRKHKNPWTTIASTPC